MSQALFACCRNFLQKSVAVCNSNTPIGCVLHVTTYGLSHAVTWCYKGVTRLCFEVNFIGLVEGDFLGFFGSKNVTVGTHSGAAAIFNYGFGKGAF